jgi:3-hydroxyisobutyrate dehydrogenase-like beta-hydroxyacid dehydrogenase
MGHAIAANLLKAGHELTVWNRSWDKATDLVAAGARMAGSPREAAEGDVAMSMLADDRAVHGIVYGEDGILASPALHVSLSTISVELAGQLAKDQGERAGFVSAPVFGRPAAAAAAKLFVVAAGQAAAIDRCMPLFDAIAQRVFRVGTSPPAANLVKLGGNFMVLAAIEAMAEAMTLVEAGGVSRDDMLQVLLGTLFGSPVYQVYGEILVADRFRPAGFAAPLGLKDMSLVDAAATASGVPMPVLGVMRDHLRSTIACNGPDIDWSSVALAIRKAAGRA